MSTAEWAATILGLVLFLGTAGGWIWSLSKQLAEAKNKAPVIGDTTGPITNSLSLVHQKMERWEDNFLRPLLDWHNVADPDDPTQKIWWNSVAQRTILRSMQALQGEEVRKIEELTRIVQRLLEALEALESRMRRSRSRGDSWSE